jgi:hypothetical protein
VTATLIVCAIALLFVAIFLALHRRGRAVQFGVRELGQPSAGREGAADRVTRDDR